MISVVGAVVGMACGAGSVAIGCAAVVESGVAEGLASEAAALSDVVSGARATTCVLAGLALAATTVD